MATLDLLFVKLHMDSKKKKILIAGHTGFVGKYLSTQLDSNGFINLIPISRSNGVDLSIVSNSYDIDCNIVVNHFLSIHAHADYPFRFACVVNIDTSLRTFREHCFKQFILFHE